MGILQQPCTVFLLLGPDQIDGFLQPRVRSISNVQEVLQATQHVVMRASGKRELQPSRIDHFAGALTPEQLSFEKVFLAPPPGRDGLRRATACALVRQQSFQHSDRAVKRRANRAALRLAVPPTVRELLGEQPGYDVIDVLTEVDTQYDGHAVNAR